MDFVLDLNLPKEGTNIVLDLSLSDSAPIDINKIKIGPSTKRSSRLINFHPSENKVKIDFSVFDRKKVNIVKELKSLKDIFNHIKTNKSKKKKKPKKKEQPNNIINAYRKIVKSYKVFKKIKRE